MKFLRYIQFYLLSVSLSLTFFACERPVPKDRMFCSAAEVYVLEKPFDKASAIIVMYRGDEVKLLGDTVFHFQIDSTKKDSSDFCVNVSAKRGVQGWVHIKELQKEKVLNVRPRKKSNEALVPKKETVQDSTINADSTQSAESATIDTLVTNK